VQVKLPTITKTLLDLQWATFASYIGSHMGHPTFSSTREVPTLLTDSRNKDQRFILEEEQQWNLDSPVTTLANAYFQTQPNPDECFIIYASNDIMYIAQPTPNNIRNFLLSMGLLANHQHTAGNMVFTSSTNCLWCSNDTTSPALSFMGDNILSSFPMFPDIIIFKFENPRISFQ
jgi:hypothetical protein